MPAELARSTIKIYKKLLRSKIEEVTTQTRCTDRSHKGGIRDRRTRGQRRNVTLSYM